MIEKFRYWCHKILPTVYDDSLSYYELLCKILAKLNEVIDSQNALTESMQHFVETLTETLDGFQDELDSMHRDIDDFKDYVNGYLDNLDIATYVDTEIRELIDSGEFDTILDNALNHRNVVFIGLTPEYWNNAFHALDGVAIPSNFKYGYYLTETGMVNPYTNIAPEVDQLEPSFDSEDMRFTKSECTDVVILSVFNTSSSQTDLSPLLDVIDQKFARANIWFAIGAVNYPSKTNYCDIIQTANIQNRANKKPILYTDIAVPALAYKGFAQNPATDPVPVTSVARAGYNAIFRKILNHGAEYIYQFRPSILTLDNQQYHVQLSSTTVTLTFTDLTIPLTQASDGTYEADLKLAYTSFTPANSTYNYIKIPCSVIMADDNNMYPGVLKLGDNGSNFGKIKVYVNGTQHSNPTCILNGTYSYTIQV